MQQPDRPATRRAPRARLGLTLPQIWLGLAVALPVLGSLIVPLAATDLAWHLRAGAAILETGAIPTVDTWTFTAAGSPWVDQQWLAQVIFAAKYQVGGWPALVLARALAVGLIFGLLALAIHLRNPGLPERTVALLTLLAFLVASPALALRPQLLGIALFALVLVLVADRGRDRRRLWLVPLVVVAWANVHGSFVLAPILVGLAWLEDVHERVPRAWETLAVAVIAALASLVNPLGPGVWAYAAGLSLTPDVTGRVSEWQPLTLRDGPGLLFWASAGAVVALLARRRSTTPWPALLGLAAFAALAAYAARGLAWWPLVAAVIVAGLLPPAAPRTRDPRRSPFNTVLVAAVIVAGLVVTPAWRTVDPGTGAPRGALTHAPGGITAGLRSIAAPGDRVWNPQSWGSWFEFALPGLPVAIDSRIELFSPETWAEVDAVRGVRAGWPEVLDRHAVTIVVTATHETALAAALEEDAGWRSVHTDGDGAIWVRSDRPSVP